MVTSATMSRTNALRNSVSSTARVNVTELARSKTWRKQLPECDVMEIIDRGSNAGWLVSNAGMEALLDTIAYLEDKLEMASMAAIINARRDYDTWMEGDELARTALSALGENGDEIKAVLDAN